MAIISFSKDAIIDYVPEYGGNRQSDDPCVVRLKYVPFSKVQEYARLISARTKGGGGGGEQSKAAEIAQQVQKKEFVENVESISGYFVEDREVTDPAEFYETADSELVTEIIRAMESSARLTEGQRKN